MKEEFTVTITRSGWWFEVWVKSDETERVKFDFALLFPSLTARRLKREIIKARKPKNNWKKTYKI